MMFDEEISKDEMEDMSVANFLAITNKAYNLYLNQEIEDLEITTEQIPFIMELDNKESISKKDLAKYLFLNDRNTAKGLMELYRSGIIDRKPSDNNHSDEKATKNNEESSNDNINGAEKDAERNNQYNRWHDFNTNIEVGLTQYGKEVASKIKEIDAKWEELIYKNLETSDKDEIMKDLKDLAISSLKTNKDANISDAECKVSKAQKIFDKILGRIFNNQNHMNTNDCDSRFNPRADYNCGHMFGFVSNGISDDMFNRMFNMGSDFRSSYGPDFNQGHMNHNGANFRHDSRFDSRYDFKNDFRQDPPSDYNNEFRAHDFHRDNFNDFGRKMSKRGYEYSRNKERIPEDDFRHIVYFKSRKFNHRMPFFR